MRLFHSNRIQHLKMFAPVLLLIGGPIEVTSREAAISVYQASPEVVTQDGRNDSQDLAWSNPRLVGVVVVSKESTFRVVGQRSDSHRSMLRDFSLSHLSRGFTLVEVESFSQQESFEKMCDLVEVILKNSQHHIPILVSNGTVTPYKP